MNLPNQRTGFATAMAVASLLCTQTSYLWFDRFDLQVNHSQPAPWQVWLPMAALTFVCAGLTFGRAALPSLKHRCLKVALRTVSVSLLAAAIAQVIYPFVLMLLSLIASFNSAAPKAVAVLMLFVGPILIASTTFVPSIPYVIIAELAFLALWPEQALDATGKANAQ